MGISQKMDADIKALPSVRGLFNKTAWWTPTNVIGKETLTISHILPSFLVLAFGLFSSVIAIVLERMLCYNDDNVKPTLQHSNIDSNKGTGKSGEESTIDIHTDEATIEPEEIIPEVESGANKEPNIGNEEDSDDKTTTLVEIHDELCKEECAMEQCANGAEKQGIIRPKPRRRMSSNAEVGAALRGIAAHTPPRF